MEENTPQKPNRRGCLLLTVGIGLVVLGFFVYRYVRGTSLLNQARTASAQGDLDTSYATYKTALDEYYSIDPFNVRGSAALGIRSLAKIEYEEAIALFNAGRFQEAFDQYAAVVERGKTYPIGDYSTNAADGMIQSYASVENLQHTAYQAGNCPVVQDLSTWLLQGTGQNIGRTRVEANDCRDYTDLVLENTSSAPSRAVNLIKYLNAHETGLFVDTARDKLKETIQKNGLKSIATPKLCDFLNGNADTMAIALEDFALYCGLEYLDASRTVEGLELLESFVYLFPDHPEYQIAVDALADHYMDNTYSEPAGELAAPTFEGYGQSGVSTYKVTNDTPYALKFVLSGPENYFVTLPACPTCQEFAVEPFSCPTGGSSHTFYLEPGTYSILVETISESVTPYRGGYTYEDGAEYSDCYYVVTHRY